MLAEIIWDKGTLGVVMGLGIPLLAIIGAFWYHIEKVKSNNALKQRMIERGMSVEEIERVMAAGESTDE